MCLPRAGALRRYRYRLKAPTFGETCNECGGDVKIIASIEDHVVIRTILAHLDKKGAISGNGLLPDCRASPGSPMDLLI